MAQNNTTGVKSETPAPVSAPPVTVFECKESWKIALYETLRMNSSEEQEQMALEQLVNSSDVQQVSFHYQSVVKPVWQQSGKTKKRNLIAVLFNLHMNGQPDPSYDAAEKSPWLNAGLTEMRRKAKESRKKRKAAKEREQQQQATKRPAVVVQPVERPTMMQNAINADEVSISPEPALMKALLPLQEYLMRHTDEKIAEVRREAKLSECTQKLKNAKMEHAIEETQQQLQLMLANNAATGN